MQDLGRVLESTSRPRPRNKQTREELVPVELMQAGVPLKELIRKMLRASRVPQGFKGGDDGTTLSPRGPDLKLHQQMENHIGHVPGSISLCEGLRTNACSVLAPLSSLLFQESRGVKLQFRVHQSAMIAVLCSVMCHPGLLTLRLQSMLVWQVFEEKLSVSGNDTHSSELQQEHSTPAPALLFTTHPVHVLTVRRRPILDVHSCWCVVFSACGHVLIRARTCGESPRARYNHDKARTPLEHNCSRIVSRAVRKELHNEARVVRLSWQCRNLVQGSGTLLLARSSLTHLAIHLFPLSFAKCFCFSRDVVCYGAKR